MDYLGKAYPVTEASGANSVKFVFVSMGNIPVIKLVEYTLLFRLDHIEVFNLGFGDYDRVNDRIIDDIETNNGDVFPVFSTVLSTVQRFFERFPRAAIMVQGSDSRPEFTAQCLRSCTKNCTTTCKKQGRRIRLYRGYLERNYDWLCQEYRFDGGFADGAGLIVTEPYIRQKPYEVIIFSRKIN